jgi:hypothetical protein
LKKVNRVDVITVYRGSFSHNGYITDAKQQLDEIDCSHFIIMHDDVLLNPSLNESNILNFLCVNERDAFVPYIWQIDADIGAWHFFPGIVWKLFYPNNSLSGSGLEYQVIFDNLPPISVAKEKMRRYGLLSNGLLKLMNTTLSESAPIGVASLLHARYFSSSKIEMHMRLVRSLLDGLYDTAPGGTQIELPYPFAMTGPFSDFYILPKYALTDYAHISGIFAAANIFVEVVVGTVLVLSADNVVSAREKDLTFKWSEENRDLDVIASEMLENRKLVATHPFKIARHPDRDRIIEKLISNARHIS